MDLTVLFTYASIFLALVGFAGLISPISFMAGSPDSSSQVLLVIVRIMACACLGIAVTDWRARNSEPSPTRNAIIFENIFGFSVASIFEILAVIQRFNITIGVVAIISAIFVNSFLIVGLSNLSDPSS